MSEPQDRLDVLERQVGELREELARVNRELVESQLEAWRSRVEDLELQAHLARMDATDEVTSVLSVLRERWVEARDQVLSAGAPAGEALDSLRSGVEQALDEVRSALRNAVAAFSSD